MASEKTPALLIPTKKFDEKNPKDKACSKSFLSWVLAAILIALIVALCVQFWFPIAEKRRIEDIDTIHVFQGTPIEIHPWRKEEDKKQSKDEINPQWHLDFLINPTRLCDTRHPPDSEAYRQDPEVRLLVLVPSATGHFEQRKTIRRTWGSTANLPHGPMRLGFVLGTTSNATEETLIMHESEANGDIIQADFQDTFRNLTTKSVLMLKWVSKHCPHAQYFLKADDDTFVNLNVLTDLLKSPPFSEEDKFIGGYIHRGAQPSRSPNEKYYVSEDDYPDKEYPPYASGAAYVTTGPTATELFHAAKNVKPFLPMEDVFVTGLCADDIAATLLHEPSFKYIDPPDPLNWSHYSSIATAHSVTPDDMEQLWNQMTRHIFDIFDFPDSMSSSDSSEWFDRSILDLFDWSKDSQASSSYSREFHNILDKFNSPEIMAEALNWESNEINTESYKDKGASPSQKKPSLLSNLFPMLANSQESPFRSKESQTSDPMNWPLFPFLPFLDKPASPNVNITYYFFK
ncbi:N-acetyllactosaminide beta-1,3-N-acetylglucosaminyltransferase 3-like [Argiope bruennichi]|uniref:N-acetyllactosaminide beta-1,3-N-acetylglucosaminyltransferase 3-like n=1 Tax=Argiope bruennichi TaxID=94029 RepID=UPI00249418EC|nr:N-acetyllactosaminide beta-1,3-N-acetylglucosaminyltransferase 3-like [Argiope bruennichi]